MDKSDFDALIRKEQEATAHKSTFDPQAEKDEWLKRLNFLYDIVKDFLKEYVDAGQVQISTKSIMIDEEQTGPYDAPQMLISIGRKMVKMTPIGTFIIGAKGRVDVIGSSGDARLILTDKNVTHPSQLIHISVHVVGKEVASRSRPRKDPSQIEWTWKIVGKAPRLDFQELTKERWLGLLAEVGNG